MDDDDDSKPLLGGDRRSKQGQWTAVLAVSSVILLIVAIGLAVALATVVTSKEKAGSKHDWQSLSDTIRASMFDAVRPSRMVTDVRTLSQTVHWAGTAENANVAAHIESELRRADVDNVTLHEYDVLLSYPDAARPNTFDVYNGSDWTQLSNGLGERMGPDVAKEQMGSSNAPLWWNGYAKPGVAQGTIVYANYGRKQDYKKLDEMGVDMRGAIVIVRYGKLWRGGKVYEAEKRGAVGAVIFNDPSDYGPPKSLGQGHTFPDDVFLGPDEAQRGTLSQTHGDPTSPFVPSKNYTFRRKTEQQLRSELTIPNIPVMPMGYRDAKKVLMSMDGPAAPVDFVGGLNLTYSITGSQTYRLSVHGTTERRRIANVCAWLWGGEEPDRYVIYGNHYDAWTNGAVDPNSGTAMQLEVARVFAQTMRRHDWRPRRTVAFCFWDAEEYMLLGSWEWVEEYIKLIEGRAVANINTDIAVSGNVTIVSEGMPSMNRIMQSALSHVANPNTEQQSMGLANMWQSLERVCNGSIAGGGMPSAPCLKAPGSGSDHYGFMAYAGVPIISTGYDCIGVCKSSYALYHTMYEVPWLDEHLMDPGFLYHKAVAQFVLEVGRTLADAPVIPFGLADYANMIDASIGSLKTQLSQRANLSSAIDNFGGIFDGLKEASGRLNNAAAHFQTTMEAINANRFKASAKQREMLNKRATDFERAFVAPRGLYPERQDVRHVVFAASVADAYSGSTFAGVTDTGEKYAEAVEASNATGAAHWLRRCNEALAELHYAIDSAQLTLRVDGWH